MDQRNANPNPSEPNRPGHVPTEAEIARAEAEAVAAMRRGEAPRTAPPAPEGTAEEPEPGKAADAAFVPYVDDVAGPEDDEAEEDDEEYIPGEWEKRISALDPKRWRLYQIIGGAAVGAAAIASLTLFGEELSMYGLLVAALLALLLPRYLERAWRCKLTTARYAMVASMVVCLAILAVVAGVRTGFSFKK